MTSTTNTPPAHPLTLSHKTMARRLKNPARCARRPLRQPLAESLPSRLGARGHNRIHRAKEGRIDTAANRLATYRRTTTGDIRHPRPANSDTPR